MLLGSADSDVTTAEPTPVFAVIHEADREPTAQALVQKSGFVSGKAVSALSSLRDQALGLSANARKVKLLIV